MTSISSIVPARFNTSYAALMSVFVITIFLVMGYFAWREHAQTTYASYLSGTEETVIVGGEQLLVRNGIVEGAAARKQYEALQLAYAKTLARRAPIFGLAGTDVNSLRVAVHELAEEQEQLMREQIPADRIYTAALYHPDTILAFTELETSRRAFIAEASKARLREYRAHQRTAATHYLQSLYIFKKSFDRAVPLDAKSYVTAQHVIRRTAVEAGIEALQNRFEVSLSLMRSQHLCIRGYVSHCSPIEIPQILESNRKQVSSGAITLSDHVRALYTNMRAANSPLSDTIVLDHSTCIDERHTSPLFATTPFASIYSALASTTRVIHLGNMRFVKTAQENSPYFEYYRDHDVAYVPVYEFNFYSCPLLDADVAMVRAVSWISERVKENPFSAELPDKDLRGLESRLVASEIYESDARTYVALSLRRAQEEGRAAVVNEVLPYALALNHKSAGFESTVADVGLMTQTLVGRLERDIPSEVDPASLYMFRSGLVPLFFGSNTTFGPAVEPFEVKPVDLEEPFVYLSDLEREGVRLQALIQNVRTYYEYADQD